LTDFHWLSLLTCAGQLSFAILALGRRAARPLSSRLAWLGFVLFAWNAADLAADLDPSPVWEGLDHVATTFTTPVAFHFLVSFVGEEQRRRVLVRAAYVGFGLVAAAAVLAPGFGGSVPWAALVLAATVGLIGLGLLRLRRHERRVLDPLEASRARLVLLAFAFGLVLGTTDLARVAGLEVPRLSNLGTLIGVGLLTVAVLRLRLLEAPSRLEGLSALALGLTSVGAYLLAFEYVGARPAALALIVSAITAVTFGVVRGSAADRAARRHRLEHELTLGRFAAETAHNLKNPLAVVHGAAQFMLRELDEGRSIDDKRDFLEQIEAEVERMRRVLEGFGRLGRVEPRWGEVRVNELAEAAAFGLEAVAGPGVEVELSLDPSVGAARGDADLLAHALGNLVENALQALEAGGRLVIGTAEDPEGVRLFVKDDGPGMTARVRARALDDFFTTKVSGSGLGLAFVRRVAEAHHGRVEISSDPGRGTTVSLHLPREASA